MHIIHAHGISKTDCKAASEMVLPPLRTSPFFFFFYWFGELNGVHDRFGRKCLRRRPSLLRCLFSLTNIWLLTKHLPSVWHELLTGYRLVKVKINTPECICCPCPPSHLERNRGKPGYIWLHMHPCVPLMSWFHMYLCAFGSGCLQRRHQRSLRIKWQGGRSP